MSYLEIDMAFFTLSATPATAKREGYFTSTTMALMSHLGGRRVVEAKSVDGLKPLILSFGRDTALQHPGRSFKIMVTVNRGSRKPRGFDAAYDSEALGTSEWLETTIADPVPHEGMAGVASWGTRYTPFRMDGAEPREASLTEAERLSDDGHLGFKGWAAEVAASLETRGAPAAALSSETRDALVSRYRAHQHPALAAAVLSAASQADQLAA
ncbi:hypothetical protein GFGA_2c0086 (plasmid) [Gluconobacter frateurii NBRC 103465]|nr:hypothetical protein GFGA_2c0086 [Gluconobacter frateurii NBRC 103465]